MLSSRGVMEGGGEEAQGQEAGQKMCKLFLTHYNRADGSRQRRLLCNSVTQAKREHQSCWSASSARTMGKSTSCKKCCKTKTKCECSGDEKPE